MPPQVDTAAKGFRIMRTQDATDEVDVASNGRCALDTPWLDLMRARGKKVVYYCCGQPYVGLSNRPCSTSRCTGCARLVTTKSG